MATSTTEFRNTNDKLRREILSYKPGKAVPCDNERVVFPDKLVIGIVDVHRVAPGIVHALRHVLHGEIGARNLAAIGKTSTGDQEEYITDYLSVIMRTANDQSEVEVIEGVVRDLAGMVGCMVQFVYTYGKEIHQEWIERIKRITGRSPVCAILPTDQTEVMKTTRLDLHKRGITSMYVVPWLYRSFSGGEMTQLFKTFLSDEEQFQWLNLLHGCLQEGDRSLAIHDLMEICKNPRCKSFYEKTKKEVEELSANHERLEREISELRTKIQLDSEIRSAEKNMEVDTTQLMASENQVQGTSTFQDNSTGGLERSDASLAGSTQLMASGNQVQCSTSTFQDNSTGGLERSDASLAGEEPPDDEFADILKKIADDLFEEAKIDSLGGQLGIINGHIQRALMTNVKFNRVTSDGTRHMLNQWRRGVSREDERVELRKALQAAKLVELADLYLSERTVYVH